jgi:hypothetical protein
MACTQTVASSPQRQRPAQCRCSNTVTGPNANGRVEKVMQWGIGWLYIGEGSATVGGPNGHRSNGSEIEGRPDPRLKAGVPDGVPDRVAKRGARRGQAGCPTGAGRGARRGGQTGWADGVPDRARRSVRRGQTGCSTGPDGVPDGARRGA